jgi:hypothetical protein
MQNWLFACQDKFSLNDPFDVEENDEHAIDFPLHLSRLFSLVEFVPSVNGSCYLPRTLVYSLRWSPSHISRYLYRIWCTLAVGSIAKSHQVRYTTPNKRT